MLKPKAALAVKFSALTASYLIVRAITATLFPFSPEFGSIPDAEARFVIPGLFLECVSFAAVAVLIARKTRLDRPLAIWRLFLALYLVSAFLTQIETFFFRAAFPVISDHDLVLLFLTPLLPLALLAAGAVLLFTAPVNAAEDSGIEARVEDRDFRVSGNPLRWLAASILYMVCYFGFGMIAQLSPALQAEYAEFYALPASYLAWMLPFQLVRGVLFAGCSALLAGFFHRRRDAFLGTSLALSVWIAAALFTPSVIMSPALRLVHGLEITASMLLYGALASAVLTNKTGLPKEPLKRRA